AILRRRRRLVPLARERFHLVSRGFKRWGLVEAIDRFVIFSLAVIAALGLLDSTYTRVKAKETKTKWGFGRRVKL
ncbi:MAG TPA: hypothetical protein VI756_30865, partial [Blastocatellia bacterium]